MKFRTLIVFIAMSGFALSSRADTVFSDTFGSGSTLDQTPTAPTSTSTSYENFSQGAGPNSSIASGNLNLNLRSTSSVFGEIEALFTASPVTLATVGDSIDLTIVFKDTANVLGGSAENGSAQLSVGLYDSGGVPLNTGTRLDVSAPGVNNGAAGYAGYIARTYYKTNAGSIITRPAQDTGGETNQDLLFNNAGSGAFHEPTGTAISTTGTTNGVGLTTSSTYTLDYQITLSGADTLTISNAIYSGSSVAGTPIYTEIGDASGATLLTTNFDAFAIGFRHTGASSGSTMDINSINVSDFLQAVPEPTVFALSAFGGLGLLAMRRFKSRK